MKTLNRNMQTFYYATLSSTSPLLDANGLSTGEYTKTYAAPIETKGNISPARGSINLEQFGIHEQYTKTIVIDNVNSPIAADTVLWIGITPGTQQSPNKPNYVVIGIAKSLNSITLAVKEAEVG